MKKNDYETNVDYLEYNLDEILQYISDEDNTLLLNHLKEHPKIEQILELLFFLSFEFSGSGLVDIPLGDGTSDSIPSRLSAGEFVFTAKSVDAIGAKTLYKIMRQAHKHSDQGKPITLIAK